MTPPWTEDQGSTTTFLDKQIHLETGSTYRIKNDSSVDLVSIPEATGIVNMPFGFAATGTISTVGDMNISGEHTAATLKLTDNIIKDNSGNPAITFNGSALVSNINISGGTISGGLTWSSAQNLNNGAMTNVDVNSGTISGVTIDGSLTWSAAQTIGSLTLSQVYGGIATDPASTNFNNECIHKAHLKMDDSDIIFDVDGTQTRYIRFRSNEENVTNGTLHIRSDNIYNEDGWPQTQYGNDLTLSTDGYLNLYAENTKGGATSTSVKIYTQPQTIDGNAGNFPAGIAIFAKRSANDTGGYIDIGHNNHIDHTQVTYIDITTNNKMGTLPLNDGYEMDDYDGFLYLDWNKYEKLPFRTGSTGSYETKGCQKITHGGRAGDPTIESIIDDRFNQVYSITSASGAGLTANNWCLYSSLGSTVNNDYDHRPDFTNRIKFQVDTANGNTTIQGSFEAISNIKTHGYFHQLGTEMILGDSSTLGDRTIKYTNSAGSAYSGIDRTDAAFCITNGSFPTDVNDHHFKIATDGTLRVKENSTFVGTITAGALAIDNIRIDADEISTVAGDAETFNHLTIKTSGPADNIVLDTQNSIFATIGNADVFKVMRQADDAAVFMVSQAGVITLINGETINNTTDNQVQITAEKLKLGTDGDTVLKDNAMDVDGDWIFTGTGDITITSASTKDIALAAIGTGEIQLTSAEKIRLDGTTVLGDTGYLTITDNEIDVSSGDLTIDVAGDIVIDADGDNIDFKAGGNTVSKGEYTDVANTWYFYENNAGGDDAFTIEVKANGETKLESKDVAGANADLTLKADGNIDLDSVTTNVTSTTDIVLTTGRNLTIDAAYSLNIDADKGVNFTTGVGFTRLTPTFGASVTAVQFIDSNKQYLTLTGNITGELRMVFPNVSGNFTLLVKQDGTGSRTIAAWKTFDQNTANETDVVWAGGSAPTLTTTADKLDIVSFYWDNDNHIAYGVVTKNF